MSVVGRLEIGEELVGVRLQLFDRRALEPLRL